MVHVKDLLNCHVHGSVTDHHRQILSRYLASPVRSSDVFGDICWCRSVKDEKDATRISRMGLETIRRLTDELRMRYERATNILTR